MYSMHLVKKEKRMYNMLYNKCGEQKLSLLSKGGSVFNSG